MDFAQAQVFSENLLASEGVSGWKFQRKISYGKSAVVMEASKNGQTVALKVFHPGLIESYGRDAQIIRINREKDLIGRDHPNLIKILEAGECKSSGYLFVAMAYAPGIQLSKALSQIDGGNIKSIIEQLARAAKQLEDWGLTHRDIKPDNIHIDSNHYLNLVLLDFGVMKPQGDNSATTLQVSKGFLGTHQYSPPEMIHGREKDTIDGWRAITFYQLGAVLHDLILRKPLFSHATIRHADLVNAIDGENVNIQSNDADPILCNLATRCLLKRPEDRIEVVNWSDFMFSSHVESTPAFEARRDALLRKLSVAGKLSYSDAIARSEIRRLAGVQLHSTIRAIKSQFDQCLGELGALAPTRTSRVTECVYPESSVTYEFSASPDVGLMEKFRVQLSLEKILGSELINVHIRASKGREETEIGWTSLGSFLSSADGMSNRFQEWMLTIVEELVAK